VSDDRPLPSAIPCISASVREGLDFHRGAHVCTTAPAYPRARPFIVPVLVDHIDLPLPFSLAIEGRENDLLL